MQTKNIVIIALVCILIGAAAGAWGMYHFKVLDLKDQVAQLKLELALAQKDAAHEKAKPAREVIDTRYVTDIQYVPKETVIIRDPVTGRETSAPARTDMQASLGKIDFFMLINGREIKLMKAEDESFMFEKNKIVLTQTGKIVIDVTQMVEALVSARLDAEISKRVKHFSVGLGMSNHGPAAAVGIQPSPSFSISYRETLGRHKDSAGQDDKYKEAMLNWHF